MKTLLNAVLLATVICQQDYFDDSDDYEEYDHYGFIAFKSRMEDKVKNLAAATTRVYGERCQNSVVSCERKSYNLCEGTSVKKCFEDYPSAGECVGEGALMSEETTIRFPNDQDPFYLDDEQRQFVCASALMDSDFKNLDQGRNFEYGMAYVGSSSGSFRSYPSSRQINSEEEKQCNDYDPRYRPWYVGATSGAKNVILMIDVSDSMQGTKIEMAKQAASSVVSTLSNNDFVGVITFESSANSLVDTEIKRATDQRKELLQEEIELIQARGGTNYADAFNKGFEMLRYARGDQFGNPCMHTNIFLFLTDGRPTEGLQNTTEIIWLIQDRIYQTSGIEDIILFTYAMGEADTSVLQEMSCEFNGIMFEIDEISTQSQLATVMKNYYSYIAAMITISEPIWTEPYEDAFGFGQMVTVSMPVYYEENGARVVLGAVGIDVLIKTITNFGISEENIVQMLIEDLPCFNQTLDRCEIQDLRPTESSKCGLINCSINRIQVCDQFPTTDLFAEVEDTEERKCCSLMIGQLVGIVVGVLVLAVCIGVIIRVWIRRKREEEEEERYQERRKAENQGSPATFMVGNSTAMPTKKQMEIA